MRATLPFLILAFSLATGISMAQPTDNPYKTRYGGEGHWTDSLPWTQVYNAVTEFNILPDDGLDDSASVANALSTLSASGGGVLFFPAGVYHFSGGLSLRRGVILRGETPALTAKDSGYAPPTRFEFPRYYFDSTANGGTGVANSSAFKRISCIGAEASDLGIVNIDINRAGISIAPEFITVPGYPTVQPRVKNKNIIVWGVRNNNVASPDPGIPFGEQRPWQRFSYRHASNMSLYSSRNLVCANNRINDIAGTGGQDDSYNQPYRLIRGTSSSGSEYFWLDSIKGRFSYTDHYGINVNKKSTITYATPENDPAMFAENGEVLDNWVYKTMRVAIRASGLGLVVRGNVLRDRPDKVTYIHATGRNEPHGSNTFENRGIDVSGWKVRVENNDLVAYRHRIINGPYYSVDGEGILIQECCGGTSVNDYKFNHNLTNGTFISFYKMRDLNNLEIVGNNLTGPLMGGVQSQPQIWVDANTNGATYYLNNVRIDSNQNVNAGIICTGSKGGYASRVTNNQATDGRNIRISCHVENSGNSGFAATQIANNGGLPCLPVAFPKITTVSPSTDTVITNPGVMQYPLRFRVTEGDLTQVRIRVLSGALPIAENLTPAADSTITVMLDLPEGNFIRTYSARIASDSTAGALVGFSNTVTLQRKLPIQLSARGRVKQAGELALHPNPAWGHSNVRVSENRTGFLFVTDLFGRVLLRKSHSGEGSLPLELAEFPAGTYLVRYVSRDEVRSGRLVLMK